MAIVDMQRIHLLAMSREKGRLLRFIQRLGVIQITPVSTDIEQVKENTLESAGNEETLVRVRWAISRLLNHDPVKQSMFKPLPLAQPEQLENEDIQGLMEVVEQLEALEKRSGDIRGNQTRLTQAIDQLKPWLELPLPVEQIKDTATSKVWSGYAPQRNLANLMEKWKSLPVAFQAFGQDRDAVYFVAVAHRSIAEDVYADLRAAGFQQSTPPLSKGLPKQHLADLEKELHQQSEQADIILKETSELGVHLPSLRLAFEMLSAKKARMDAMDDIVQTRSTVFMAGWVPKSLSASVQAAINKEFPDVQLSISDPGPDEEPPVLLQNPPITQPYEAVISGFALPAPGAVDPTNVMMPFFACFFGMMVSDAGYGLVMALLIPLMVKIMQPSAGAKKIFWIICGGGIATVIWGALYNTWFGFGPWPTLFDPVNDSLPVMALCIGIGALHLFAGLALGAYQNIKKGEPMAAVYDQLSWFMLVIGLGMLALPQTAAIGKWLAIGGAGIVLLTAGRDKSKNPIKRLVSGLGALYGVTSWISDLLSYMRLFGMGLATGVIGMVINQLVGMMMGGGIIGILFGVVVFIGAHLFNAAINILGAYVHACRLQYIEFFGKFYEEGGKPFKPLRYSPRYVRIHE